MMDLQEILKRAGLETYQLNDSDNKKVVYCDLLENFDYHEEKSDKYHVTFSLISHVQFWLKIKYVESVLYEGPESFAKRHDALESMMKYIIDFIQDSFEQEIEIVYSATSLEYLKMLGY